MENGLELFNNPEFGDLRLLVHDDEVWFVAKDVCDFLGTQTRNLRAILEEDEVLTSNDYNIDIAQKGQGGKDMLLISEPGFYSLILKARRVKDDSERTERIRRFRRWVTHDILPTIRKTGSYGVGGIVLPEFNNPAAAARAWADMYEQKIAADQALALEQEAHEATKEHLVKSEELRAKAIREKSWIGERREATAMATASVATRKANKLGKENEELREQIGDSTNWKTVKAYGKELEKYFILNHGCYVIIGKRLTKMSREMGFERKDVEDHRYGTTGAYHVDVWERFFYTCKNDLNFLKKYRNTTPVCGMAA